MSIKSKSPLLVIISIAILLFISAIIWKLNQPDNSEIISSPPIKIKNIVTDNKNKIKINSVIEPTNIAINSNLTIEQKHKKQAKKMGRYVKYKTPEQILEAINTFEILGNVEEVEELYDHLLKRFPDYKL